MVEKIGCGNVTILWGDVALAYQEMEGRTHIALKQDFGPFWLWRKNKKIQVFNLYKRPAPL
jgi:hypothetical protein